MQNVLVIIMRFCCVIMINACSYVFSVHTLCMFYRAAGMGCSHLTAFVKLKKHLSKVKVENKKKVKNKTKSADVEAQIGWLLICRVIVF